MAETTAPGMRDPARRTITNTVVHDEVTFDKYAREVPGQPWTDTTFYLQPGGGAPMHYHNTVQETFTPIEGGLGIHLAGKELYLEQGQSAVVPIGKLHRFYNSGKTPVRFTCKVEHSNPSASEADKIEAAEGFEKMMHITYGLASAGGLSPTGVPKNPLHLAVVLSLGDTKIGGAVGVVVGPFISLLAWVARITGVQDRLLDQYWRDGKKSL